MARGSGLLVGKVFLPQRQMGRLERRSLNQMTESSNSLGYYQSGMDSWREA